VRCLSERVWTWAGLSPPRCSWTQCRAVALRSPHRRAGVVGLDHLSLTAASLREMGAEGLFPPITLSCRDHEGGESVQFLQWDGKQWHTITDWIATDQALVRPLVEASAVKCA
jgi:hypothetical protein